MPRFGAQPSDPANERRARQERLDAGEWRSSLTFLVRRNLAVAFPLFHSAVRAWARAGGREPDVVSLPAVHYARLAQWMLERVAAGYGALIAQPSPNQAGRANRPRAFRLWCGFKHIIAQWFVGGICGSPAAFGPTQRLASSTSHCASSGGVASRSRFVTFLR